METSYIASAFTALVDKETLVNLSANRNNIKAYRKRSGTGGRGSSTSSYLIGETAPKRPAPLLRHYLGISFVLLLSVGILFLLLPDRRQWWKESRQPAQQEKEPMPAMTLPRVQLPTIMRQAKKDPSFTENHPGWARYQTDALEYRLYTVGKTLRAVQVICLNGGSVTDDFFHSFVRELSGREPPPLAVTGEKDGFTLERGINSNGTEYQVYRQTGNKGIRAFVVALP